MIYDKVTLEFIFLDLEQRYLLYPPNIWNRSLYPNLQSNLCAFWLSRVTLLLTWKEFWSTCLSGEYFWTGLEFLIEGLWSTSTSNFWDEDMISFIFLWLKVSWFRNVFLVSSNFPRNERKDSTYLTTIVPQLESFLFIF